MTNDELTAAIEHARNDEARRVAEGGMSRDDVIHQLREWVRFWEASGGDGAEVFIAAVHYLERDGQAISIIRSAGSHGEWHTVSVTDDQTTPAMDIRQQIARIAEQVRSWPAWQQNILVDSLSPTVRVPRTQVCNHGERGAVPGETKQEQSNEDA